MDLEPLGAKFEAFGWAVAEVDGHDVAALREVLDLSRPPQTGKPTAIIARTTKGKGVGFMEDTVTWHYKSPNDEQLHLALAQLEGS
jgi:transketolase